MLIGTPFRRPNAPIDMGDGTIYYFKPRDPNNPASEHVCLVTNREHIQKLLAIPEGYYIAEDGPAAAPAAKPTVDPPAPTTANPQTPPAGEGGSAGDAASTGASAGGTEGGTGKGEGEPPAAVVPEEIAEAAANLVALSWQGILGQTKKGGIPKAVLMEALRLEEAKPDDERRSAAVKALKSAIEAA